MVDCLTLPVPLACYQSEETNLQNERVAFVYRARSEPLFLIVHVADLARIVGRKIKNKIKLTHASGHRGLKVRPKWLDVKKLAAIRTANESDALTLPKLSFDKSRPVKRQIESSIAAGDATDPEDYLARHRWRHLMESLFSAETKGSAILQSCILWIEENSNKNDAAWEPYSTSERVANLLTYLASIQFDATKEAVGGKIREFLNCSLDWIYRHLEYYGPRDTNNHILNNARALVMGGVAIGNQDAVSVGMKIFRNCLPTMILSNGFLRERSSHYQFIILNWVLDTWRFISAYGIQRSADAEFLRCYIQSMVSAGSMLCARSGALIALIGDISPDATPEQSLARLALLYPEFWPSGGELRGAPIEKKDGWFRIASGDDIVLGNFPAGIYPLKYSTHGHVDFTGFVWQHDSTDILVDSGRYRYISDVVSLFQKSAFGHNLPVVNGFPPLCESLVAGKILRPLPYAAAKLEMTECDGGIRLRHNGYARATPVHWHSRQIVLSRNESGGTELSVLDTFSGQGVVEVGFYWHFGQDFNAFDETATTVIGKSWQVKLSIEGVADAPKIESGSGGEYGGWLTKEYGVKVPTLSLRVCCSVKLPAAISTTFVVTSRSERA